jgi:diguanylate cyclase (GGDEF)-like protein
MTATPQFSKAPETVVKKAIPVTKINWLKGKLSWRVIMSVFATIVVVQSVILYCTVQNYKQSQLDELGEVGRSTLSPLLPAIQSDGHIHLPPEYLQRLIRTTPVRGVAFYKTGMIYANDLYGEPPMLVPDSAHPDATVSRLNPEDSRYEVSFGPQAIERDYVVVIRLDSTHIQHRVLDYIRQSTLIAILLSAFITSVLIMVLGKWMIEPILILRHNLLGVARDPGSPSLYLTHYSRRDELGSVISSANKLIKQNADHMSRISQQAQDKIYKVAFFDALTDLPNRVHFLKKLDEILLGDERHRYPKIGVLVMDIDHFGDVNNTLGYEAGDKLLKNVAEKLTAVLPDSILIARLSEDEFAAIVNLPYEPEEQIDTYVASVLKIFEETFIIDGNELVLEGSAGMALWPDDADTAAALLKKAETALDQAKLEEDGHFRLYSPSFDLAVQNRIQMINDLRFAIEDKQFSLVYQPQISATTRKIIGAEALLRWNRTDPETGKPIFTGPDKFIPVAEQSGLIVPIGRWVIEEACRFAMECQKQGLPEFRIAVNLSGIQFHRDDVISLTRDVLQRTGLAPHLLELEVTESAVMKDIEQTINLLQQLKNLGVELAIDDFGTGYSSLSYLKRFPVHRLKIDRSFVINITENPDEATITKTIINLGHAIGLNVIAEGVETVEQVDFLTENGCDEFQGYYFSKPLQPNDFKEFVKSYLPAKSVA